MGNHSGKLKSKTKSHVPAKQVERVSAFELEEGAASGPSGSLCPTFLKADGAGCRFSQAQPFNHYAWWCLFIIIVFF